MTRGKWIWHFRDFEFYHGMQYLLAREERGKKVPAFFECPRPCHSVRFSFNVRLDKEERIHIDAEGDFCFWIDGQRQNGAFDFTIPAGDRKLMVTVGNACGLCAICVSGETILSSEKWIADAYDCVWEKVGTSPLLDSFDGKPGVYRFPEQIILPVSDRLTDGGRLLDFGKETIVRVRLKSLSGRKLDVFYGESREETMSPRCVIVDSVSGKDSAELPSRACRFLRFVGDTDFEVEAFTPILPESRARFRAAEDLKKIYDVSEYTLALCSRMFFLDGIKRDRWPWAGDAYITAKMNTYSFADHEIVKRTLLVMRGNADVKMPVNNILEYSFYWFLMLRDYWFETGDADFVKANYDYAVRLLDYYRNRRDDLGFIPPIPGVWLFIDWHKMDKDGDVCVVQMLYGAALSAMAELAEVCGKEEDAKTYREQYLALAAKIDEVFWNEELGAYVSVFNYAKKCTEVRRHPNYFAVLLGYADGDKQKKILDNVVLSDAVPAITTPFFKFFEYDVLFRLGRYEEAFDGIRKYWNGILSEGATTIWEEYVPEMTGIEKYAMYGEPFDKSLCHAWGAGPLYFFGRYLAGVRPTSLGCASFEVSPYAGLGDFSSEVPIGAGHVRVSLDHGTFSVFSDIPGGGILYAGKRISLPVNCEVKFGID